MTMTARKLAPTPPSTIVDEIRHGRNFVRKGDVVKVRLNGKTQFKSGFTFIGWDTAHDVALVKDPYSGNIRSVPLDGIKRNAVTKNGERKIAHG